jgi:hypothetical protein
MSAMITYADLADLAEAMGLPGAGHLRLSADIEAAEDRGLADDARDELYVLHEMLGEIPEPSPSAKHGDDCWQRHARCLADRILSGDL